MAVEIVSAICLVAIGLIYLFYWYFTKEFNYWKDRNVPYLEPTILLGSVKDELLNKKPWLSFINKCYDTFKDRGFGGIFFVRSPSVWICSPQLIEKVLVEDFAYFHDRWVRKGDVSPQGNTLLYSKGEDWRSLRLLLAPSFASGKVKGMFQQILSSTENVLQKIAKGSDLDDGLDVEPLSKTFATEVLASCLCGVDMSNSWEAIEFQKALDILCKPTIRHNIYITLYMILPTKLLKYLRITMIPREAIGTLSGVIESIVKYREQSDSRRDDILQRMVDLRDQEERNVNDVKDKEFTCKHLKQKLNFTDETIAAQILGFMSGGIRPIAAITTLALYEISQNSSIQSKLHEEIDLALSKNNSWTLEALKGMTFLDQVIQETLRLYSINPLLMRSVKKKNTIPGTDVTLDEDMQVFIPVDGIHKDPDLYACPLEFRPERWKGNNYRTSSSFLPFGHGPRICISIRLAVLTMKLCLARVLRQYKVSISPKMTLPMQFDVKLYFKVKGGVWLKFDKRV